MERFSDFTFLTTYTAFVVIVMGFVMAYFTWPWVREAERKRNEEENERKRTQSSEFKFFEFCHAFGIYPIHDSDTRAFFQRMVNIRLAKQQLRLDSTHDLLGDEIRAHVYAEEKIERRCDEISGLYGEMITLRQTAIYYQLSIELPTKQPAKAVQPAPK